MSAHKHLSTMMRMRVVRNCIRVNNVTRGSAVNVKHLTFTYQLSDLIPVAPWFQVIINDHDYLSTQVLRQAQYTFVRRHIQYFTYVFRWQRYWNVVVRIEYRTWHAQINCYRLVDVAVIVVTVVIVVRICHLLERLGAGIYQILPKMNKISLYAFLQ
jgi:hypothetical protein